MVPNPNPAPFSRKNIGNFVSWTTQFSTSLEIMKVRSDRKLTLPSDTPRNAARAASPGTHKRPFWSPNAGLGNIPSPNAETSIFVRNIPGIGARYLLLLVLVGRTSKLGAVPPPSLLYPPGTRGYPGYRTTTTRVPGPWSDLGVSV